MQQSEIVQLAMNAGLSQENAILASAVAMAESGGNQAKVTRDSDDESYGLWQINMLGSMGPARRALYGLKSNNDLLDPATNAHVMSAISAQGRNWSAWGAYTNGSYKAFMPSTSAGFNKLLGKAVGAGAGLVDAGRSVVDVATSASQAVDALQKLASWTSQPKNWVRVVYVTGGVFLIGGALIGLIYSTQAGKAAVGVAKTAITKGKTGRATAAKGPEFAIRQQKAQATAAAAAQKQANREAVAYARAAGRAAGTKTRKAKEESS